MNIMKNPKRSAPFCRNSAEIAIRIDQPENSMLNFVIGRFKAEIDPWMIESPQFFLIKATARGRCRRAAACFLCWQHDPISDVLASDHGIRPDA